MRSNTKITFGAILMACLSVPGMALAHDGTTLTYGSFVSGLTHPVLGLDRPSHHLDLLAAVNILSHGAGL